MEDRKWETKALNFDNVFKAMLTLYTSSTGEGWPRYVEYLQLLKTGSLDNAIREFSLA